MAGKSICVFGGTGFVGRELVAKLAKAGHEVIVPTRNRDLHRDMQVAQTVRVVAADVHNREVLRGLLRGRDVAINLVGILNEQGRSSGRGFANAHLTLTEKIVETCRAEGVGRLLHMSALHANAEAGPSHYLKTKGQAEQFVKSHCPPTVEFTIFQPSVIFGKGDGFINRFAALLTVAPFLPLAKPNARFQPVYVGDVAEAFIRSIDDASSFGETYPLVGPKTYSLREIVAFIGSCLGLQRLVMGLPDSLAALQARVFEWVPGKPFSIDNYKSLGVDSVSDQNGLPHFGIRPRSMESIVPRLLRNEDQNHFFSRLRRRR
jgi:NADH dehydrogenase